MSGWDSSPSRAKFRHPGPVYSPRGQSIGKPEGSPELALKGRRVYEKWVFRFGGEIHNATSYWPLLWTGLRAPEYTLFDILNIRRGVSLYNDYFRSTELPGDLAEEILTVRDPVYFFTGRHD
jgi:hypothetical protein